MISINIELIKVKKREIDVGLVDTVNARDLYEFLEVKSEFRNWIKNRIKDFEFLKGVDFISGNFLPGSERVDYFVSLDMAKELSMLERNVKGRTARKYFIERDKHLSKIKSQQLPDFTDPAIAAEAWATEFRAKTKAQLELKEAQPKIEFANHIEVSKDSISVADFAKLLHKNGVKLGQNKLFKWFYDQRYLMDSDKPYQKWMDQGLFEIKKISFINGRKEEKTAHKVMVTGKGQTYLTKKVCASFQIKEPVNSQTQF